MFVGFFGVITAKSSNSSIAKSFGIVCLFNLLLILLLLLLLLLVLLLLPLLMKMSPPVYLSLKCS